MSLFLLPMHDQSTSELQILSLCSDNMQSSTYKYMACAGYVLLECTFGGTYFGLEISLFNWMIPNFAILYACIECVLSWLLLVNNSL